MTTTSSLTTDDRGHGPDRASPAVFVRIVLFGGAGAGVTTTVEALGDRLGQPVHDGGAGGRTLAFDWLEYEGGRHDGRSIRTQVVGVSGPVGPELEAILDTADVVLFVADTSSAGMAASADALHALRTFTSVRADAPSLLYLANKRDDASAVPIAAARSQLAIHDDEGLLETVAPTGDGVRQAFVYGVREALRRLPERDGDGDRSRRTLDDLVRAVREVSVAEVAEVVEVTEAVGAVARPLRREHLSTAGPRPEVALGVEDLVEESSADVHAATDAAPADRDHLATLPPPPVPQVQARAITTARRRRWSRRG